jgi:FkbM family methyltransferase
MISREHVVWAYRLLLDRDPEGEDAILPKLRAWKTTPELRTDLMSSEEFRLKNPDRAAAAEPTVVIKPLASGARLFIDLCDHVIGLAILRGGYEQHELAFAKSVLRPGDVAVDVGAHIGFFTIELAQTVGPRGHIYAFEPLPSNAALLEQSIRENYYESRVTLERSAVSNKSGTATLRYAEHSLNTGGAFLSEGSVEGLGALSASTVRTVRLDDYHLRRPVRLIKMDVEGAEPSVVSGARELIARDRPVIVSEVHPEQLARVSSCSPADFVQQLSALGLHAHRIEGGQLGAAVKPESITAVTTLAFVPEAATSFR